MLTILGITFTYDALVSFLFFLLFLWSEYLGGNKQIDQNSVSQLLYRYLRTQRKEDDKLTRIISIIKEKK